MWRCISNHPFGYCNGTPDWQKEPEEVKDAEGKTRTITGGICKLNYKDCGKYLASLPDHPELKSNLKETITPIEEKEEPIKKTEKPIETAQGKLF